jgi:hypothetical protein
MREKKYALLFSLLRSALWGEVPQEKLSQEDFTQVLVLSKEQTVLGFVFDVLKDSKIDGIQNKAVIYQVLALTESIKHQNRLINQELISFAQRSKDAGLDYLVVKGQTLGCLYRSPELRSSGDIDFLVPIISQKLSKVFPNVRFPEIMKEKELEFKYAHIIYELHTRLIDFGCKKHQRVWEDLIGEEWKHENYVEIDGVKVRTLLPTINAVYLFLHLYFHLIREGVSFRQFCDWAVFLHHYRNEIDKARLNEILRALDMIKGYRAFGSILVDELGLPKEDFPMAIVEDDRKLKEKILEDIFQGGNFGKQNHKAKTALGFKFETLRMAIRNSIRYYSLAPSEMRMMIPKMVRINLRLLFG